MSDRRLYSDKVRYMARKNAGAIQKMTGVPASTIVRIREGKVKRLSEDVSIRLEMLYDTYFRFRMERGGINVMERESYLRSGTPRQINKALREASVAARLVRDMRRHRDRNDPKCEGYNDSWHTINNVKEQMSKDYNRNVGDWVKYVKGIFNIPAPAELPQSLPKDAVYEPKRMPKYTIDKKGHRHLSEKWVSKVMKGEDN